MTSSLTLEKNGAWRLRVTAETQAEKHMVSTLQIPWRISSGNASAFLEKSSESANGELDVIVVEVMDSNCAVSARSV